ncbi:MAG: HK97 family phage prohead protease [Lactobacillus sp.]|jgi:HK97 family phage prohead protease|nr:HK97 family phage prohead protease [Lactobacillus sp.]
MKMAKRTALTLKANFRADGDENEDGNKYLEGYFVKFNDETELWPGYLEQVSPDAIADDINDQDIRALFDHDTGKVLGRTKSKTLTLTKDEDGLYGKILLNQNDPEAMSIYAKVARGDVSQASFGFFINDEQGDFDDSGVYHSLLRSVELFEVSIVALPAYPSTEIDARSKDLDEFKNKLLEQRKQKLIKELKTRWKIQSY